MMRIYRGPLISKGTYRTLPAVWHPVRESTQIQMEQLSMWKINNGT
jgi:hypothetical protein